MINYYSKLPNEIQIKIINIIISNYYKLYNDSLCKCSNYLIYIYQIELKYFDYNEPLDLEYPHQLTRFFRHKFNPLIGNLLCNIGDIVINKNLNNTTEYIVLGFRFKYLDSNLNSIVCFRNDIIKSYSIDYYNQRYILLGKLHKNIDKYNLSNYNDIEIEMSNWKDKILYTCYLDNDFIIKQTFQSYNKNIDIVNLVRKKIGLEN